jgi:hypothetical protein
VLVDPESILPTRGYRVLCHDATLIDLEAEGMWPLGIHLDPASHPCPSRPGLRSAGLVHRERTWSVVCCSPCEVGVCQLVTDQVLHAREGPHRISPKTSCCRRIGRYRA